jgi:asparagine synthase (glutamine-hydrolysing)
VPAPILKRAKKGFNLPLDHWMRGELAGLSRDLLTDATARTRGLFDTGAVRRLLAEHATGISHGRRLWNLTVLELWLRQSVDHDNAAVARACI